MVKRILQWCITVLSLMKSRGMAMRDAFVIHMLQWILDDVEHQSTKIQFPRVLIGVCYSCIPFLFLCGNAIVANFYKISNEVIIMETLVFCLIMITFPLHISCVAMKKSYISSHVDKKIHNAKKNRTFTNLREAVILGKDLESLTIAVHGFIGSIFYGMGMLVKEYVSLDIACGIQVDFLMAAFNIVLSVVLLVYVMSFVLPNTIMYSLFNFRLGSYGNID